MMNRNSVQLPAPTTGTSLNKDLIERMEGLEHLRKEILTQYNAFTADQLTFKPDPGHWNVLQVLNHIIITEKMASIFIKRQLGGKKYPPAPGVKSQFRYALLKLTLKLPFRYKTSTIADSTGKTPDFGRLTESWNTIRTEIRSIIESTDSELLDLGVYEHPRAGLIDMEKVLEFLDIHIRRHQKQIERIIHDERFPE